MHDGEEPKSKDKRKKLRNTTIRYILIEGELYKCYLTMLYLKCLTEDEAKYSLYKGYEGVWGNHLGARAIAHKLFMERILLPNYKERYG